MDRSEARPLLALMITVIVLGGTFAVCFWPSPESQEEPFSVTGKVTGLSSYNQPKLDIKAETLAEHDIRLGSLFTVTAQSGTYDDAVLLN